MHSVTWGYVLFGPYLSKPPNTARLHLHTPPLSSSDLGEDWATERLDFCQ